MSDEQPDQGTTNQDLPLEVKRRSVLIFFLIPVLILILLNSIGPFGTRWLTSTYRNGTEELALSAILTVLFTLIVWKDVIHPENVQGTIDIPKIQYDAIKGTV